MREMMEQERGEPSLRELKNSYNSTYGFDWTSLDDVEYSNVSTFYVVMMYIVIYFKAAFSGSEFTGAFDCNVSW